MIAHHKADVGDVEPRYAKAPGSGPPLLLHGRFSSLETYLPLMPELAEMAHVDGSVASRRRGDDCSTNSARKAFA